MDTKYKFGTKEWSDESRNIFTGKCKNGCVYCYASANMARYNRPLEFKLKENYLSLIPKKKTDKVYMFPTTHDIRLEDIDPVVEFITGFLKTGNKLLIVSKPNLNCIIYIINNIPEFNEENVEFRFSIGSTNDNVLSLLEPNAPNFKNRINSLQFAFDSGFKTSVSIEPLLTTNYQDLIKSIEPYVTETIWIGKLNNLKARLKLNKITDFEVLDYLFSLENAMNDNFMIEMINDLKDNPKIRFKESILKIKDKYSL